MATRPFALSDTPLPAHWYLAARVEADPWKRFLWAFFALERLTNDAFDDVKKLTEYNPQLVNEAKALDPSIKNPSLRYSFAVVACAHSPTTAASDLAAFTSLAGARNDLSHGTIASPDGLPTGDALNLLEHYLKAILEV